jgi:hypothetical protein
MQESMYQEIKKLHRFRYLKVSLILFILSIMLIILGVTLDQELSFIPFIFISAFALFFLEFGFLIAFAVAAGKNEGRIQRIIIESFWQKKLDMWTYEHDDTFQISNKKDLDRKFLTHPMIPGYATEQFYYTLTNTSHDLKLHALRYTHQVSTGKGTSQAIDFSGYFIQTKEPVSSDLYVRKWDINEKLKVFFMTQKPDLIEDGVGINGTFDETMKLLRKSLFDLGYKDVILLEQDGLLTILCEASRVIPKVMKDQVENEKLHKAHILNLVKTMDYVKDMYR